MYSARLSRNARCVQVVPLPMGCRNCQNSGSATCRILSIECRARRENTLRGQTVWGTPLRCRASRGNMPWADVGCTPLECCSSRGNLPWADVECTPSNALLDVETCRGRITSTDLLNKPTGVGGWRVAGPHPLRPDWRGAGPLAGYTLCKQR